MRGATVMLVGHQGMAALLYRLLSKSCMIQLCPFLAPASSDIAPDCYALQTELPIKVCQAPDGALLHSVNAM